MKTLALSIGLLFSLAQLQAVTLAPNKMTGLFFNRYYVSEEQKAEDIKEGRIVVEGDIESLDNLSFEAVEAEIVLPNGETYKSALYLKDFELRIKIKDEFKVIGLVIEKRIALVASVQATAKIEDGFYVLQLSLSTLDL